MAQSRYYSSTAQDTTLSTAATSGITTLSVAATTGFPSSFPYTLAIGADTASEELVSVTGASGTNLTVVRGFDGTAAVGHEAGTVIRHVHSAADFNEAREHEAATAGVHGIADTTVLETQSGAQSKANTAETNAKAYADTKKSEANTYTDSKVAALGKVLLIENGAAVPGGTATGTIIFEKG